MGRNQNISGQTGSHPTSISRSHVNLTVTRLDLDSVLKKVTKWVVEPRYSTLAKVEDLTDRFYAYLTWAARK